jgi:hypothetical protein
MARPQTPKDYAQRARRNTGRAYRTIGDAMAGVNDDIHENFLRAALAQLLDAADDIRTIARIQGVDLEGG